MTHRNDFSYSGYNQIILYLKDKIINTLANYEAYLSQFKILGNNLEQTLRHVPYSNRMNERTTCRARTTSGKI